MRLISLAPSNTEILYALGLEDQVVAVTHMCDFPPAVKRKPKIGSWITTSAEKIAQYQPDYIFTSYFLPQALRAWNGPGQIVHVVPMTIDQVFDSVITIGKATKRIKQAQALVDTMKKEFAHIAKATYAHKPKIYMEEWFAPPMASGNWVPELVTIAGGIHGISFAGKPSSAYSLAMLQEFNPDLMMFHWCGWGSRFDDQKVRSRPYWNTLKAIKNNQMYSIDDSLINRPGPRLVEGAKRIQSIISAHFWSGKTSLDAV